MVRLANFTRKPKKQKDMKKTMIKSVNKLKFQKIRIKDKSNTSLMKMKKI